MGHAEELIARIREFEAAGTAKVYPEDLARQLRDPDRRAAIDEIEERSHHPRDDKDRRHPPKLPEDLFRWPVPTLRRIFFYAPRELLIGEEVFERAVELLDGIVRQQVKSPRQYPREGPGRPVGGFVKLVLTEDELDDLGMTIPALAAELHRRLGEILNDPDHNLVAPNHVYMGGPMHCGGPGNNPDNKVPPGLGRHREHHDEDECECDDLSPIHPHGEAGKGVRIAVLDSGILPFDELPCWMDDNIVVLDCERDVEGDYYDVVRNQRYIRYPRVHGTFVAGVILQKAPGATILVRRLLDKHGSANDYQLGEALEDVLHCPGGPPHIINMSCGCPAWADNPPAVLANAISAVLNHKPPIVIVAAAGNASNDLPYWPAALDDDQVVGVGAVTKAGERSPFSNYGPPVKVWALGQDVVSVYAHGVFAHPREGIYHRPFQGLAAWGGTSFAAPRVAGLIAAAMTEQNKPADEARAAVLASAYYPPPGPILPNGHGDVQVPVIHDGLAT